MSETHTLNGNSHDDVVNNNYISVMESKTKNLCLNGNHNGKYKQNGNDSPSDQNLFDPKLLVSLKSQNFLFKYGKYEPREDYIDLGDNLILRPLRRNDYDRQYMHLLSQLTVIGQVSKSDYEARFDKMASSHDTYYICVVEDVSKSKLVASLTLVYEQKFIRQTGSRGRVEDVVVDVDYRGKSLSKILLDVVCELSRVLGCYKISLECKDHLRKHYEQFKFALEPEQNYLCRRFV